MGIYDPWLENDTPRYPDEWLASREARILDQQAPERLAADDTAETIARARTGDLEPDGSWSPAPASSPSIGDAALGGLISGVLSAILGSGKRRAHHSTYHGEHVVVNAPIVQVVHVPRAGDYVVNIPHWGECVVSVPHYGECVVNYEGRSLVLKVAR